MAFIYRLQVLLEQRERGQDDAQKALGASIRALEAAKARLVALQHSADEATERHRTARYGVLAPAGGMLTGGEVQRRAEEVQWLEKEAGWARDAVLEQRIAIEDCEDAVEAARGALAEAMRQVEVLRKHRARAEQRYRREEERVEAEQQDESGTVQFNRRNRE